MTWRAGRLHCSLVSLPQQCGGKKRVVNAFDIRKKSLDHLTYRVVKCTPFICRYSGGSTKRQRSSTASDASGTAGAAAGSSDMKAEPSLKAEPAAQGAMGPAHQSGGCGSGQGCGSGSGASCAQPAAGGAGLVKPEERGEPAAAQPRARKKVPRVYIATRTHSQIAQVCGREQRQ